MAQYIGEICRYLMAQPERPTDKQHKVRMMFGNGLRPEIWSDFVRRFNIKQVGEFYGSTEGNANISKCFRILSILSILCLYYLHFLLCKLTHFFLSKSRQKSQTHTIFASKNKPKSFETSNRNHSKLQTGIIRNIKPESFYDSQQYKQGRSVWIHFTDLASSVSCGSDSCGWENKGADP